MVINQMLGQVAKQVLNNEEAKQMPSLYVMGVSNILPKGDLSVSPSFSLAVMI